MGRQRHNNHVLQLSRLAQAWLQLVESECPAHWYRLMPDIDLHTPERMFTPQSLPVLDYFPRLAAAAGSYRPVLERMIEARAGLYFGQTYSESDFGADFLRQYGWIKLLGPDAYWHSDELSSGFLILGDENAIDYYLLRAKYHLLPHSSNVAGRFARELTPGSLDYVIFFGQPTAMVNAPGWNTDWRNALIQVDSGEWGAVYRVD